MIYATGKLVEIEKREAGEKVYRTAHVLNGRYVDSFSVGGQINGELDELVNAEVELQLRMYTNWIDTPQGRRPSQSLVVIAAKPLHPLENAA